MEEPADTDSYLAVFQEMLTVLGNNDQFVKDLEKIKSTWKTVKDLRTSQQEQLKNTIEAWQKLEEDELSKVGEGDEAKKVVDDESEIKHQLEQTKSHFNKVKKEFEEVQKQASQCKEEQQQLTEERIDVEQKTKQSLPKARNDVNLFMNITNIRWQFDAEPDEVKGFVCSKSDVKPFSLNSKQVSKFYITNYLWDLIEEDW